MKMFFNLNRVAVVLAGLCTIALSAGVGNAGPITHTFGQLPADATFGGDGIRNNPAAITTIVDGASTITLGLIATQRKTANAGITDSEGVDGSGIYNVNAGVYDGTAANDPVKAAAELDFARWSFSYYINVVGGGVDDYAFDLQYDFDPGTGTSSGELGSIRFAPAAASYLIQDSWNLGMDFLSGVPTLLAGVTLPTSPVTSFDATVNGEYSFSLIAYNRNNLNNPLGASSMVVNAVPEPATLAMFALLTVGAAGAYRRKKRVAAC